MKSISLFLIALFIGFIGGMNLGIQFGKHAAMNEAVKSRHAEYYVDEHFNKQFRWKEHSFTWTDLNFDQ